jgi:mono/diheme cytochrome c family protein
MKSIRLACTAFVLLTGCQSGNDTVPLITAAAARHSGQSAATLREGRFLFVRRCIECHALPVVSHRRAEDWPNVVARMSARADLKPAERDAIVAYLVTLRQLPQPISPAR